MQATSASPRRPLAGGELRTQLPGTDQEGVLVYEIWETPDAPRRVWVELYPPGDSAPVPLSATVIENLRLRVADHVGSFDIDEAGIGVSEGTLSMNVRQEWPLSATLVSSLGILLLAVTLVATLRSRRRLAVFQRIAQHEVASREEERTRVAREIHDGPLQNIATLARTVGLPPGTQQAVKRAVDELRALSAGLRPPALDRFGLVPALEDLAERWVDHPEPLTVRIRCDAPTVDWSPAVELAAFRIVQEALTNAAAHGGATTAWVFIRPSEPMDHLVIRDNGRGIEGPAPDIAALVRGGHFGLAGMVERARSVGGSLAIDRGPGGLGTSVHLTLPPSP